jgi:hypothetical protein
VEATSRTSQTAEDPRKPKEKCREDRPEAPRGRQIEKDYLCCHGRIYPDHRPEHDESIEDREQADDCAHEDGGQEFRSVGPMPGIDGTPGTDKNV